jgi:hypothetical protein
MNELKRATREHFTKNVGLRASMADTLQIGESEIDLKNCSKLVIDNVYANRTTFT